MAENNGQIGKLNGKWAVLFKALLAAGAFLVPLVLPWFVWVTFQIFEMKTSLATFVAAGPRYTPDDARADRLELRQEIFSEIEQKYPPQWLRDTVESHGRRLEVLEKSK